MDRGKQKLWEKRMKDYEASGLNGTAWCKEQGIPECQFWYWKKRLKKVPLKETVANNWVPLVVEDPLKSEPFLTVRVGTVEIEVRSGHNATLLQDVVRTLLPLC